MEEEKINENSEDQEEQQESQSRAARILEERRKKMHRRASISKLISYIIALIGVLLLMLWLRR